MRKNQELLLVWINPMEKSGWVFIEGTIMLTSRLAYKNKATLQHSIADVEWGGRCLETTGDYYCTQV